MAASSANAQTATPANSWDYDTVLGGNVGKDTSVSGVTDITVTGGNGYVVGNADIYSGHTVNVTGDNSSATFAYRDNRANIQSTLDGNLNSNMNIVIIDRDGIFFTENSVVDVNSLIATAGNIGKNDLMNGDDVLNIENIAAGSSITNNGTINANEMVLFAAENATNNGTIVTQAGGQILLAAAEQVRVVFDRNNRDRFKIKSAQNGIVINTGTMDAGQGGLAALVSPFATNNGVIKAKAGTVAIASGEHVTLDMYGDGLVEVAVTGELSDALIHNRGAIEAEGGVVNITAKAAKNAVDNLINNEGIITASSATMQGGKIILSGGDKGTVNNSGLIETSQGGSVNVSGERFVQKQKRADGFQLGAFVPTPPSKPDIKSGGADINIATSGDVEIYSGTVDAQGGNVTIDNDGTFYSIIEAVKTTGTGTISVNQNDGASIQNAINAIDNDGTGENTVNVGAGTYNESIRADHDNLTLKGANAGVGGDAARSAESIITPTWHGFFATSDNVVIDGFEIAGGTSGVRVDGSDNITIVNNNIHDQYHVAGEGNSYAGYATGDGVFVENASNVKIGDNKIANMNDDGIHIVNTHNTQIIGNVILDNGNGDEAIGLTNVSGTTLVKQNAIKGARRDGIQIHTSAGDITVSQNVIKNSGSNGISIVSTENVLAYKNTVHASGEHGIVATNSNATHIIGNEVIGADANGIVINNASDSVIRANEVALTGENGISVLGSDRTTVEKNIVKFTKMSGIHIANSFAADVRKNAVFLAGRDGIRAENSGFIDIINNDVAGSRDDGIDVDGSFAADIVNNRVSGSGDDGIDVDRSAFADVKYNSVKYSGDNGIELSNSTGADVVGNTVHRNRGNGIDAQSASYVDINKNNVSASGADGIAVRNSYKADINKNTVSDSRFDGIDVDRSAWVDVIGNSVSSSRDNGIEVSNSYGADIIGNNVSGSRDNGIDVNDVRYADINKNIVNTSGDDGIAVHDSYKADIKGNIVVLNGDDGIDVSSSYGVDIVGNIISVNADDGIDVSGSNDAFISKNLIIGTGDNGIQVRNSDATNINNNIVGFNGGNGIDVSGSDDVIITRNNIGFTGRNGIKVSNGYDIALRRNNIIAAGDDGIDLNNVRYVDVVYNTVDGAGDDGIDLDYSSDATVANNVVKNAADDGVSLYSTNNIFVRENEITGSSDDGVDVENSGNVEILGNEINGSGGDGVEVKFTQSVRIHENEISESGDDGVDVFATSYALVTDNIISDSVNDGVRIASSGYQPYFLTQSEGLSDQRRVPDVYFYGSSARVDGNVIENSGGDGIQVENISEAIIVDNTINESGQHGLYVSGASNGYVQIQGNDFTDNGDEEFAQARFESGDIDLSDLSSPNTFTKTTSNTGVAMQFEDIQGGFGFPGDDIIDSPSAVDSEFGLQRVGKKGYPPFGTGLRIVNETIGSTAFTGYTGEGNFYVRFEDGSILDPLTRAPIIIDGTQASFDGIVPASFAGTALPLSTLQFLEDRIYDADDSIINGRGQLFVGFVETINGPTNFQDFLPEFGGVQPLSNAASITIASLPSIGQFGASPAGLNNIAPAAGEEGQSGEDVAGIEPAAGENSGAQVTCLEDAVGALGGGAVTYNFGGTFEDTMAGSSGCQSSDI